MEAGALQSLCSHEGPRRRSQEASSSKEIQIPGSPVAGRPPRALLHLWLPRAGVLPLPAPQSLLFFFPRSHPVRHGVRPRPGFCLLPGVRFTVAAPGAPSVPSASCLHRRAEARATGMARNPRRVCSVRSGSYDPQHFRLRASTAPLRRITLL